MCIIFCFGISHNVLLLCRFFNAINFLLVCTRARNYIYYRPIPILCVALPELRVFGAKRAALWSSAGLVDKSTSTRSFSSTWSSLIHARHKKAASFHSWLNKGGNSFQSISSSPLIWRVLKVTFDDGRGHAVATDQKQSICKNTKEKTFFHPPIWHLLPNQSKSLTKGKCLLMIATLLRPINFQGLLFRDVEMYRSPID